MLLYFFLSNEEGSGEATSRRYRMLRGLGVLLALLVR
jgi:hypothetical protein